MKIEGKLRRAVALLEKGSVSEAESLFMQVLRVKPLDFVSLYSMGVIAFKSGDTIKSLEYFDRAMRVKPDYSPTWFNRGVVLQALNRDDAALASYEKALEITPSYNEALANRCALQEEIKRKSEAAGSGGPDLQEKLRHALDLLNTGELLEAESLFCQIIESRPSDFVAWYSLGVIAQKNADPAKGLECFDRAADLNPQYPATWYNRGVVLHALKKNIEALESYDRALLLNPQYAEAYINRGVILQEINRHAEALENYDRLLEFDPANDKALGNKGVILTEFKRYEEAIETLERLIAVNPDYDYARGLLCFARMHGCDWSCIAEDFRLISEGVNAGKRVTRTLALLAISDSPEEHLICSQTFSRHLFPAQPIKKWNGEVYNHNRIRVAYVSPDMREHPVGQLMAGVFEAHDKSRFETIGISLGIDDGSALRARISSAFDSFYDVRFKSSRDIADLIRAREVDIVVDLAGYTADSRTDIFAYRPAPIQVNYLGYPGTLGTEYMDYILADRHVIPEADKRFFSEKVVALPNTYLPTDGKMKIADRVPTREEFGLPGNGFVFCSFNHAYKINPRIFDIWMSILKKVPDSILWLMKLNGMAEKNLLKEAGKRGVDPQRLIFATRVPKIEDHLARYRLAGLFLDTLPYNAHTTASDALFAGLPVLTCMGRAFPGRVAASLLNSIGLPELVTASLEEYEAVAVRLASDCGELESINQKLRANRDRYPLFNTQQFCRDLESAYLSMWERFQRGEPATGFSVK